MPRMGMTMETGVITKWYKKVGDPVKSGEPIVEIMTDKANMDVEAESSGYIYKIFAEEGEEVPVGNIIGIIKNENDTEESLKLFLKNLNLTNSNATNNNLPPTKAKHSKEKIHNKQKTAKEISATPLAKRLAKKYGIDIRKIETTSIATSKDILIEAAKQNISSNYVQKAMAQKMIESAKIPQFTLWYDFIVTDLFRLFTEIKSKFSKLTLTAFIVKATSYAIKKHPIFNSVYKDGQIITLNNKTNIGVAIATEKGLFVPTITNVEVKSLRDITNELFLLKEKAVNGNLNPQDFAEASITISNMGMFGVDMFKALLVPGQSAILAVSSVKDSIRVRDNGIFIEKIMNISISCDHRFIDGAKAAQFMNEIKLIIEKKYREILKWE